MQILYYDCFAGISGDMNLGAMLDLGVPKEHLIGELRKIGPVNFQFFTTRQKKHGIEGTAVDIVTENEGAMVLTQPSGYEHHRSWSDIRKMIHESGLQPGVKDLSTRIFQRIAEAEAKIHGVPVEDVHFHEVGAVDSIVDIVGAAICIQYLHPGKIIASAPELGGGFVNCQHGKLPVPAPATLEILKNIPVKTGLVNKETTTPTGAAILAEVVNEFSDTLQGRIIHTGYGVGHHDLDIPNVLRVLLAETDDSPQDVHSTMIECNIDDMNPELYDYIMEQLLALGADDVFLTPIIMKKSRPAVTLSVLASAASEPGIVSFILHETTSLGLRKYPVRKEMLERKVVTIQIPAGTVRVKYAMMHGKPIRYKPEYDDCRQLALEKKIPLQDIYRQIEEALRLHN